MAEREYERLLGGYATGTLTEEERRTLFDAALRDQELFNALADEQALKELLDDPVSRQRLLQALEKASTQPAAAWLTPVLEWFRRPANLGLAASLATVVIALVVGINVYKEGGFRDPGQVLTAEKRQVEQPSAESPAPLQEEDALVSHDMELKDEGPKRRSVGGKASTPGARARSEEPIGTGRTGTEQRMAQRPKKRVSERQAGLAASEEAARSIETRENIRRVPQTASAQPEPTTPQAPTVTDDKATMASAPQRPPVTLRGYFGGSVQKGPARDLFYSSYSQRKQAKAKERAVAKQELAKSPAPTEPIRADAAREEAKSSAEAIREQEKVGAVTVPATGPLGLRYSVLKRDPTGKYSETDRDGPFRPDDALRLTVEVNEPGYLYVLQQVRTGEAIWLFPSSSSATLRDFASARVVSGRRYMIPATENLVLSGAWLSSKMIIIFSRDPRPAIHALIDKPARKKSRTDQLARDRHVLLNRVGAEANTKPLLFEEVQARRQGSPSEQAVYVVTTNPAPNALVLAEFELSRD